MFSFLAKKKILVTHDSGFHADDVFACAILEMYFDAKGERYEIVRTRDQETIERADFVFDVGGIYDPARGRFDHHQKGRAGMRENGIMYAACGLVWKAYGPELCGGDAVIAEVLDKKVFQSLDAVDNGQDISKQVIERVFPYSAPGIVGAFNLAWNENESGELAQFNAAVAWAKAVIAREIVHAKASVEAERDIYAGYQKADDKRLIILEKPYSRQDVNRVLVDFPEPLYFVYPKSKGDGWKIETVRKAYDTFESRKPFPQEWAGLREADFQKASGIPDAFFAHDGRFYCVAKSKDGALALAQKALNS